jgi:hypothetical protein
VTKGLAAKADSWEFKSQLGPPLLLMLCEDISTLMVRGKPVARVTKTNRKENKTNKQVVFVHCFSIFNTKENPIAEKPIAICDRKVSYS